MSRVSLRAGIRNYRVKRTWGAQEVRSVGLGMSVYCCLLSKGCREVSVQGEADHSARSEPIIDGEDHRGYTLLIESG